MKGELYIARNEELRRYIIDVIQNSRLPFKIFLQPIYPEKTPNQLAYLFGVVCKRIADFTGHTTDEVYEGYKKRFNLDYAPTKDGKDWAFRYRGGSEFDVIDAEEFAEKIRIDAVIEMGINIELPNEVFVSELDFNEYDKIEEMIFRSGNFIQGSVPILEFKIKNG